MIYLKLFLSFLQIGAFSIGGGYAAMPLIREQVLNNGWLKMNEFSDLVTIAEMTPGPIAVNAATFVGTKTGGFSGALCATLGCILPSLIIVSVFFYLYCKYRDGTFLQGVLSSLRPTVVALIFGAGLSILQNVAFRDGVISSNTADITGILLFAGGFIILRKKKWNPILVMVLCAAVGTAVRLIAEKITV